MFKYPAQLNIFDLLNLNRENIANTMNSKMSVFEGLI